MRLFAPLSVSLLVLLVSVPCLADWKGDLIANGEGAQEHSEGKVFASGRNLRFEVQAQGRSVVVLVDAKSQAASMLMPSQKIAMEVPAGKGDASMTACGTDDIDGCYRKKGFKKTGTETLDGHPCVIYEGDEKHGATQAHQKMWRPKDLKEVFMIKSIMSAQGHTITTLVKNIHFGKLDSSLFSVPTDYKKIQMPDFAAAKGH
jgi:hypothetical protein